jgi:hypothetical protein
MLDLNKWLFISSRNASQESSKGGKARYAGFGAEMKLM